MKEFFRKEVGDSWGDVIVWFDLFCNSQHETQKSFDWWANQFASHLGSIGQVLILTCPVNIDVQVDDGTFRPYCAKRIMRNCFDACYYEKLLRCLW